MEDITKYDADMVASQDYSMVSGWASPIGWTSLQQIMKADVDRRRQRQSRSGAETLRQRLMRERDELEVAIAALGGKLARRIAQIEKLDSYPEIDSFDDGAVLKFNKRFPNSDKKYMYVATRIEGRWYLTGAKSPQGISWDGLVDFMGLGVDEVWHVNATGKARNGRPIQVECKVIG